MHNPDPTIIRSWLSIIGGTASLGKKLSKSGRVSMVPWSGNPSASVLPTWLQRVFDFYSFSDLGPFS